MSGDLVTITEIEATSAPSSITVKLYNGLDGERGAYVIPGLGNPNEYDFENAYILDNEGKPQQIDPKIFDWFIDLKPTSSTYLTTFILKSDNIWSPEFKVIPNTYNTNTVIVLVNGATQINLLVSDQALLLSQAFGDQDNRGNFDIFRIPDQLDNSFSVNSEQDMLDLENLETFDYVYRTDLSQFFRLKTLPSNLIENWQPELSVNADIDIENPIPNTPLPVLSSFKLGMPTYDGSTYTFPISIKATQLNPAIIGGIDPITGPRTAHISLSVI